MFFHRGPRGKKNLHRNVSRETSGLDADGTSKPIGSVPVRTEPLQRVVFPGKCFKYLQRLQTLMYLTQSTVESWMGCVFLIVGDVIPFIP